MRSRKLSRSPARRPRSRSMAFGGLDTLTKSIVSPPTVHLALRIARRDVEASRAPSSPAPSRRRDPCARAACPCRRRSRRPSGCCSASSFRKRMPISSRMRMAPLWMRSTASASSGSTGRSRFCGIVQGDLVDGGGAGALAVAGAPAGAAAAPLAWFGSGCRALQAILPDPPVDVAGGRMAVTRPSHAERSPHAHDSKSESPRGSDLIATSANPGTTRRNQNSAGRRGACGGGRACMLGLPLRGERASARGASPHGACICPNDRPLRGRQTGRSRDVIIA